MKTLIDILRVCSDYYTNTGDYYIFDDEDKLILQEYGIEADISTDDVYDSLYDIGKKFYPNDIFFLSIGSEVRGDKVKLPIPLGSMTECKEDELLKWISPNEKYMVSAKLDGCSCLCCYENGQLKIAYSRGDGENGQDITRIINTFENSITSLKIPDNVMIRGEVIVSKENIPLMIDELYKETHYRYKNGRNTVAGQLNSKVCAKTFSKYAHFVAYKIMNFNGSEEEMFQKLEEYGLETAQHSMVDGQYVTEQSAKLGVQSVRDDYEYECDGIIFTVNHKSENYNGYETSTYNPKESRKFKVGAVVNSAETEVEFVEWNVSKNALLNPRIKVKPVDINGVTIDWVTGHNYKNIVDNKIGQGAKIVITRRGDVIPYVEKVISPCEEDKLGIPTIDRSMWDTTENGVFAFYYEGTNDELDRIVSLQRLVYFCNKLNVKFAGEGNLTRIMNFTELNTMSPYNLINLPASVFTQTIGINGIKLYASLHECLKKATIQQLMDAVGAFGDGIGELKLNRIVDTYGELIYDRDKIMQVDGWSDISADQYCSRYAVYLNWCEKFRSSGIELKYAEVQIQSEKFKNIIACFTGIRDKEMEYNIVSGGGKIVTSVTKICNLLITKENNSTSSKAEKAREKGIEIISYDEAVKRFK